MLTERPVHIDVKNMLLNNEPFSYAHLVKFERPSRPDANGRASTSKERYTYLTDASRDLNFDDESSSISGIANGSQVYIANKVLKVGSVSEQTQAKASNFSLTLDGNGIGAFVSETVTVTQINPSTWDINWPLTTNLIGAGFREGDKVTLEGDFIGEFNILNFRANNTLRVSKIDEFLGTGTGLVNMSLSSEEIKSILLNKNVPEYASFINREVFIYRGYYQQGQIVGSPVLIFKGIISNVSFDDTEKNIEVTWGLTSHWGDFAQVKGRITSDDFHRALDANGIPQPQSALKTAYAYDKGFVHAETSLNMLSTYVVQVEKQNIKVKNGFLGLGIGGKVKVKKYLVPEDRTTELDFQLQAKSIPVIYGVRSTKGIPVFADTLYDNSSTVYVVYALSEGEIGGIYDIYINGNSLICSDKGDFDARSAQTPDNTVELVCRGRADRGDVLGGTTSTAGVPINYYEGQEYLYTDSNYNYTILSNYQPYVEPTEELADTTGKGVIDGESIALTSPQKINIDFFSGRSGAKAASQLVEIAKSENFHIQKAYWTGTDTAEYWGPNHRLLDTAYVVVKYIIEEGETTIPELEFVLRAKNIDCYNYDYSYSHYSKQSGESSDNFKLGEYVTLYNMLNTAISSSVQIIDKWTFSNPDGTLNTRFRFSTPPNLGYVNGVPSTTKFYMKNTSNQKWTMVTWNYEEFRGVVDSKIEATPTTVANDSDYIAINYSGGSNLSGGDPIQNDIPYIAFELDDYAYSEGNIFNGRRIISGRNTGPGQFTTNIPYTTSDALTEINEAISNNVVITSKNTVKLVGSSTVDDFYNGYYITLYKYDPTTDKQTTQIKKIIAYNGTTKIATIDDIWEQDQTPDAGDTVVISPPYSDKRVSINFAMQTLDYITSTTYGKGLDVFNDLSLDSWLEAGRKCDERSTITVAHSTVSPVVNHKYRWPATGDILWQGTVVGTENNYTEFTDVIGKLTSQWNNWRPLKINELIYSGSKMYKVTSAGVKTTEPVHTSGTVDGLEFLSSNISLTSSTGGVTLSLPVNGNPIHALKNGIKISGYSLYDCDEINYWRYLGWDEFSQRYVTRHQGNLSIDTSLPLFDNINSLLEHFGGVLTYSGGKYHLSVEEPEGAIGTMDSEVRNITSDHIIGKIRLSDEGTKGSFNSLTAAFADPGNKFESKNISFFNSEFLRSDRNVPKKGNISIPGITNYYNTRILADKYLNKSRFGLTISLNVAPRGLLLLSGTVIQIQYPRYGWEDKKFRITSLTHQQDCTVDIVAEEYDDSFYVISNLSKQLGSGSGGSGTITTINSPTDLIASSIDTEDETYSGVQLTWTNSASANTKNVYTEVYSSTSQRLYLTVNNVSGNVLTSTVNHELQVGELITCQTTANNLEAGKSYFVRSIPAEKQFTLSETKSGPVFGLLDGTALDITIQTANLIATLPTPTNSFADVFGGINGRVVKYYWIRHKVIKG